jgi:diguanylate cyclase (GGDEF)-like protein
MDDLKAWYREGLAARIEALDAALTTLRSGAPEAHASIRRIAHSLRGSGGTYGFPEISAAAAAVEEARAADVASRLEGLLATLRTVRSTPDPEATGTPRIGVLVVDDDPDLRHLLEVKLAAPGREILLARTAAEAEALLREHVVSIVLLDLVLPDSDGRNFLLRLRERPGTAALPVIVLTSLRGTQPRTECLALGADGYFEKPFDPATVAAAVSARLQRSAEITRELRQDTLTGLANRAAFCEGFERAALLAARAGEPLSVAIIDLDRFKGVNDAHGHAAGDEVIKRTATVILRSLRKSDFLARWGGDEFVAFFPEAKASGAALALDGALAALRAEPSVAPDGQPLDVGFSAGVADVPQGAGLEQALADADRHLYLAKGAGGGRVVWSADGVSPLRRRVLLAEDDDQVATLVQRRLVRDGLDVVRCADGAAALAAVLEGGISLAILDVRMPELDGFEVLARMRQTAALAQVPVVMLTSVGEETEVVRGLELGADDYVVKPFSPLELAARVRRLLAVKR